MTLKLFAPRAGAARLEAAHVEFGSELDHWSRAYVCVGSYVSQKLSRLHGRPHPDRTRKMHRNGGGLE